MTPQEALAQAIRDAAPNLPRKDLIIADPYTESAIAILDALRKVPGGRWVVVDRDEWDVLCERIGAMHERERLREKYARARGPEAGPYVYEPEDLVTVAQMDMIIAAILADPEKDR